MIKKEDYLNIGHTGRSHGLAGELACKLTVDIADWIADEEGRAFLMLEEDALLIPFRIEGHRIKSGDVDLIKFAGVDTKEAADLWSGRAVWLHKEVLGEDDRESPWDDYALFLEYEVCDAQSTQVLGKIVDVDETTINTLITVRGKEGEELLLPLAEELIASVDEATKRLTLIVPEGLLTDDAQYDIH